MWPTVSRLRQRPKATSSERAPPVEPQGCQQPVAGLKPRRRQPLNRRCREPRATHWVRILEAEAWVQPRGPISESPDQRPAPMAWVPTMKWVQSGRSLRTKDLPGTRWQLALLVAFLQWRGTTQLARPPFAERPEPIRVRRTPAVLKRSRAQGSALKHRPSAPKAWAKRRRAASPREV